MSGKYVVRVLLPVFTGVILVLHGCGKNRVAELKKDKLFSIPIGTVEEDIGVQRKQNGEFHGPGMVLFRNGFFFVVDAVNQKIMKITTPGDVILVISKGGSGDTDTTGTGTVLRTKERKQYNFGIIGQIAVDNENNIYVQNKFIQKEEKKSVIDIISIDKDVNNADKEYTESYMSYIVKFDRLGNFQYRLGKGGIGSDPFYYIYKIATDINGNLIVLTADDTWDTWTYYTFDPKGSLIGFRTVSREEIVGKQVPVGRVSFIMDVCPEVSAKKLVFWVSQYETTNDTKSTKKAEDVWGEEIEIENFDSSSSDKKTEKQEEKNTRDLLSYSLVRFDLDSNGIDSRYTWETHQNPTADTTEEFLGIDGKSNSFFWKYINKNKSIVSIVKPDGTTIAKRSFTFEDDGLWTNIQVAEDSSVYAVKVDKKNIYFYRWRSDKLLEGKKEKTGIWEFVLEKIREFKNANR
jgi:hypothetical protein